MVSSDLLCALCVFIFVSSVFKISDVRIKHRGYKEKSTENTK